MSPHPLISDDASSTCISMSGDTASTASSGRVSAASHPLQMLGGDDDGDGECSAPAHAHAHARASSDPLGDSASPAMSLSSERSAGSGAKAARQTLSSSSSSRRRHHRSSLSSQAFKVHAAEAHAAEAVRRVSGGSSSSEHERHLEDLVSSLRRQLDAALRSSAESISQARRYASHCRDLERENAGLKSDLAKAREEGREHRALARKVVKDNARLMREANEREADAQRLSNLAEKVRTLADGGGGPPPASRRGSADEASASAAAASTAAAAPAALAVSDEDGTAQLDAVNLSNECESLRRENARLREEAGRMEAALSAHMTNTSLSLSLHEPPAVHPTRLQHRRASSELPRGGGGRHQAQGGGRVAALKKMASIRTMTSMLNINEPAPASAGGGAGISLNSSCHRERRRSSIDADRIEVTSPEDFLWDE